jgi:type IV pilus assembly protein PilE
MNERISPLHQRLHGIAGFSMIELVVAMVIVAILAAIAIPSYQNYVLQGHRTDAKSALLDLASLEERYFSTQNTYTTVPTNLGYTATGVPFPVGSGYYNITILSVVAAVAPTTALPGGTPASYSITAAAIGNQVNDTQCASFTVTSGGQQTALNSGGADNSVTCWQH